MTTDEAIAKIESLTPEQILDFALLLSKDEEEVAPTTEEPKAVPSAKIKCKVCGFHKRPKAGLRETGICKPCTVAVKDGEAGSVEVIGRMGKRGRNTVSVVIDGQRFTVKRLSSKHSERVAARYASKPKGYAKRGKRTGSEPKGLPTSSRIGADQHRHES